MNYYIQHQVTGFRNEPGNTPYKNIFVTVHDEHGMQLATMWIREEKHYIWIDGVHVEDDYRRLGIATTLYCYAEETCGKTLKASTDRTRAGKSLWAQDNRPFGVQE